MFIYELVGYLISLATEGSERLQFLSQITTPLLSQLQEACTAAISLGATADANAGGSTASSGSGDERLATVIQWITKAMGAMGYITKSFTRPVRHYY